MPTYEYECESCKRTFEIFHRMSEKKKKCPRCGAQALKQRIGPGSGFLFKGSGFYSTDYRSTDYIRKAESEKPKASEPEKKDTKEKTEKKLAKESKKAD